MTHHSSSLTDKELQQLEVRLARARVQYRLNAFGLQLWCLSGKSGYWLKRSVDITVAASALIVASPIMFIVALLIKLTDGGPVLFWQTRVGKWGKPFDFPKFRSMVVNAEGVQKTLFTDNQHGSEGITFKIKNDPRITKVGRFIRKSSIDELPQLWCVLKGDMSLVGPRPALVREVKRYTLDDRRRLDTTPGITCIWQVSGRAEIPFPEQVKLDVQYIQEQSLLGDIKLLLKTIPAVITGRGAY